MGDITLKEPCENGFDGDGVCEKGFDGDGVCEKEPCENGFDGDDVCEKEPCENGFDGDDVCEKEVENHLNGDKEIIYVSTGKPKKTRGPVYCRKLTALAPRNKIFVELNADGVPIGDHASLFAFFLGEQVRNQTVLRVQVNGWEDFKS
ncbi:hypothetical protein vseg_020290 [Gypsophila vaccaria]